MLGPLVIRILHLAGERWLDRKTERAWLHAFFGPDEIRLLWAESAKSRLGVEHGVRHWRLFCDETWRADPHAQGGLLARFHGEGLEIGVPDFRGRRNGDRKHGRSVNELVQSASGPLGANLVLKSR